MATLKEYEEQVKKNMSEENWAEAYKICEKILSYDPENTTFIRYRNRIEKEVKNVNRKAINQEFLNLEHLLHEKNYEQYLREIAPLQLYVKEYPEIGQKIVIAKALLDKQYAERRDQAFREVALQIKKAGSGGDQMQMLQQLENLYKMGIHKREIAALTRQVKGNYIRQQLRQNEGLIQSNRYEDTIIFLLKLKKLDEKNSDILKTIDKVKKNYQHYKLETKKDFIFKTLEEIKTLYITKKYELCLQLCDRVLEIDPENRTALQILQKARSKADRQSIRLITEDIIKDYGIFKETKAFQDKDYIRL